MMQSNRFAAFLSDSEGEEEKKPAADAKAATKEADIEEVVGKKRKKQKGKAKAKLDTNEAVIAASVPEPAEATKKKRKSSDAAAPLSAAAASPKKKARADPDPEPHEAEGAKVKNAGVEGDSAGDGDAASSAASGEGLKKTLPGGVVIETTRAAPPGAKKAVTGDVVKLLYEGKLPLKEMKTFDKGDIDFVLGDGSMVVGFERGVNGMLVGERRTIYIPAKFGYGKKGKKPKVPPNSDLVFDVILTSAGTDWTDMTFKNMSVQRREKAKRRGKKPRRP
mmetsp:Transcript_1123/g.2472  ORF Transcript_1123/g.2472 Transcript_1123/m.2472 type:complete len:278 (-) Transcript_1123:470-1303(-)